MTKLWLAWISVQLAFGYHPAFYAAEVPPGTVIIERHGDFLTISAPFKIDCSKMANAWCNENWVYSQKIDISTLPQ